jgi:hypothetical protein
MYVLTNNSKSKTPDITRRKHIKPKTRTNITNNAFRERIKLFRNSRSKNSKKSRSMSISRGKSNNHESDIKLCMKTVDACEKAYNLLEKDLDLSLDTIDSCEKACKGLEKENKKLITETATLKNNLRLCEKEKEHYWKLYGKVKDDYKKIDEKLKFYSELGKKMRNKTVKGQVLHIK